MVRAGALAAFHMPSLVQLLAEPWGTKTGWEKHGKPDPFFLDVKILSLEGKVIQPQLGKLPMKWGGISQNAPCGLTQIHGRARSMHAKVARDSRPPPGCSRQGGCGPCTQKPGSCRSPLYLSQNGAHSGR